MSAEPDEAASRTGAGRLATVVIFLLAGFLVAWSALASGGKDLRGDRTASLRELVAAQAGRNEELRQEGEALRGEVDLLRGAQDADPALERSLVASAFAAGMQAVTGPGVRVVLNDAPADVNPAGVTDDALVVHQQDIQAVVNAMWSGGAEAMVIQGQRVIATTGIKCVGNSVVLHGIPYAPPYVIEAIGPAEAMFDALGASRPLQIYREYVQAYGLGYHEEYVDQLEFPAFVGAVSLSEARSGE